MLVKIVVIGGGTGLSVLLRGIKRIPGVDLTAVVSVADDGGSSGILREDLGMLPPGDIRSCLLALANEEDGMRDILAYRFSEGRLAGQSVGNLILAAASEIFGSFENGIERISDILKVEGRVVPVSGEKIVLCAELENGNIVIGESQIAVVSMREGSPISNVFLEGANALISASAINAIQSADIVIVGPGSLYTSIAPNLLMAGMDRILADSDALKLYIANVMTQPGETDGMGLEKHVEVLCRYLGGARPDYVIANSKPLSRDELCPYIEDGAEQILPSDADRAALAARGIGLLEGDFIDVKKGYIRHDAQAAAQAILTLYEKRALSGGDCIFDPAYKKRKQ